MNKIRRVRLALNRESIRTLTPTMLEQVNGGGVKTMENRSCSESWGGVGANTACDTRLSVTCGYDFSDDLCK